VEFVAQESSLDIVVSKHISLIYRCVPNFKSGAFYSGNFAAARLSYLDIFSCVCRSPAHRVFEVKEELCKKNMFWAQLIGAQLIHSKCLKMNELLFVPKIYIIFA
jgi:hypothetical protein